MIFRPRKRLLALAWLLPVLYLVYRPVGSLQCSHVASPSRPPPARALVTPHQLGDVHHFTIIGALNSTGGNGTVSGLLNIYIKALRHEGGDVTIRGFLLFEPTRLPPRWAEESSGHGARLLNAPEIARGTRLRLRNAELDQDRLVELAFWPCLGGSLNPDGRCDLSRGEPDEVPLPEFRARLPPCPAPSSSASSAPASAPGPASVSAASDGAACAWTLAVEGWRRHVDLRWVIERAGSFAPEPAEGVTRGVVHVVRPLPRHMARSAHLPVLLQRTAEYDRAAGLDSLVIYMRDPTVASVSAASTAPKDAPAEGGGESAPAAASGSGSWGFGSVSSLVARAVGASGGGSSADPGDTGDAEAAEREGAGEVAGADDPGRRKLLSLQLPRRLLSHERAETYPTESAGVYLAAAPGPGGPALATTAALADPLGREAASGSADRVPLLAVRWSRPLPEAWDSFDVPLAHNHAVLSFWGSGKLLFIADLNELLAFPTPQKGLDAALTPGGCLAKLASCGTMSGYDAFAADAAAVKRGVLPASSADAWAGVRGGLNRRRLQGTGSGHGGADPRGPSGPTGVAADGPAPAAGEAEAPAPRAAGATAAAAAAAARAVSLVGAAATRVRAIAFDRTSGARASPTRRVAAVVRPVGSLEALESSVEGYARFDLVDSEARWRKSIVDPDVSVGFVTDSGGQCVGQAQSPFQAGDQLPFRSPCAQAQQCEPVPPTCVHFLRLANLFAARTPSTSASTQAQWAWVLG